MALFHECMQQCPRKALDTADISRSGAWSSAGSTGVQLWDSFPDASHASYEAGPAALRPDGTVFATGANGGGAAHTSIYNTATGIWTPGPDFPDELGIADGPACTLPNGNVFMMASPLVFQTGAKFLQWDGSDLAYDAAPNPWLSALRFLHSPRQSRSPNAYL
jgi:hypothetical protein